MNGRAIKQLTGLAGLILALSSGGCATYQPATYANDGYYGAPDYGYSSNGSGYYGRYHYDGRYYGNDYYGNHYGNVPAVFIGYALIFGTPYYGYAGCAYWSPYCRWYLPGYGYGFGYGYGYGHGHGYGGYGYGWGRPPYGGYRPPQDTQPKPKPPQHGGNPPQAQQPIVRGRPIRALPGRLAHPESPTPAQTATPPVGTGSAVPPVINPPAVTTPADNLPVPRDVYWRVPANRRLGQPDIPAQRPASREFVRVETDEDNQNRRSPGHNAAPGRNRQPAPPPANDEPAQRAPDAPVHQSPPPARESKPVREKPLRKTSANEDADP